MAKVITFGEILLRLSPPSFHRFLQANSFDACFGGAEANVAASLANFGVPVSVVTKVPEHEIGRAAAGALHRAGISTEHLLFGGDRLGIYFLEKGASQRPSKVIYDRKHSSFSEIVPQEFDWETIFKDAEWFHFTGITPALGENVARVCLEACKCAKKRGLTISCDLNYRKKLWDHKRANEVMSSLIRYADVCIANESDVQDVFGMKIPDTDAEKGKLNQNGYRVVAKRLHEMFNVKKVAFTLRRSFSASQNDWSGLLYDAEREEFYESRNYSILLVDRVGAGDSFSGALIYALLNKKELQEAIEFAVAASCLKQTIPGDMNCVTVAEVESLMRGDDSGRVKR